MDLVYRGETERTLYQAIGLVHIYEFQQKYNYGQFKCEWVGREKFFCLKGPKHEIFESEFFTQIRPVRVDDLGTGEKNDISQIGAFV
jgi:hypothetical protein